MATRRHFIRLLPMTAGTLAMTTQAQAQVGPVDEKSPQALGLGYVSDAARADKKKYTRYAAGQACSNCSLFQGKATDTLGDCPLFAGKQVAGKGWCSAYAKKG